MFVDCRPGLRDLEPELRPILESVKRYGCASVYTVKDRPDMARAAGRPDEAIPYLEQRLEFDDGQLGTVEAKLAEAREAAGIPTEDSTGNGPKPGKGPK